MIPVSKLDGLVAAAQAEIDAEERRAQIDAIKAKLTERRPLWRRLFPFKITITRTDA